MCDSGSSASNPSGDPGKVSQCGPQEKPVAPKEPERAKCYKFDDPSPSSIHIEPSRDPPTPTVLVGRLAHPPVAPTPIPVTTTGPPSNPPGKMYVANHTIPTHIHVPPNVLAGIHPAQPANPAATLGFSDTLPPAPDGADPNKFTSSIAFSTDRLANPDVSTKPGTLESIKRNEEIWVFAARFFNNYHVSLCPGVTGKQLAIGLKSLNDRLRPLYEALGIPCGLTNRICIGAAALTWGSRPGDPDHVLGEQDFVSWKPNHFDTYAAPGGWVLEPKARVSSHIETWRINAQNMTKMFGTVYGLEHVGERMQAVEDLRLLHVKEPHKYTLGFVRNAWNTLNHRWVQEIKEAANLLRLHAQVERPTFDQLKSIGMTIEPTTGTTIFKRPNVFNVMDLNGFPQTEIVRKMNAEKELADWHHYHNAPTKQVTIRTGAVPVGELPGPPITSAERRMAGTTAPLDKWGRRMCWNFNSHLGCKSQDCQHVHETIKKPDQLSWSMRIVMAKRGGFKGRKKIPEEKVADEIQELRKRAAEENRKNMKPSNNTPKEQLYVAAPITRVSGAVGSTPSAYWDIDYVAQESELRQLAHGPVHEWATILPQHEDNTTPPGKVLVEPGRGRKKT